MYYGYGYGQTITYANMEQLTLQYAAGDDSVTVASTAIPTTIDLGSGVNTLTIGEGLLSTVGLDHLTLVAPGSNDTIEFDNSADPAGIHSQIDSMTR